MEKCLFQAARIYRDEARERSASGSGRREGAGAFIMKPVQIICFLDDYRQLHGRRNEIRSCSKLISIKVPENLLNGFNKQAALVGTMYQTQIKILMKEWVLGSGAVIGRAG
jgi:hypothetical protein